MKKFNLLWYANEDICTVIRIHEEQNISSTIIFCGGALNKKKNILCGYFDDELLIAWW